MHFLWVCFCLLLVSSSLVANNVVYLVVEGASQHTFYGLLQKQALPHFQAIIDRGNYRNLAAVEADEQIERAQSMVYSGIPTMNHETGKTVYDQFNDVAASHQIKFFLTSPVNGAYNEALSMYLGNRIQETKSVDLAYKSSQETARQIVHYVKDASSAFLVVANFTNVDYVAQSYREGAQLYSSAIKKCDKALGKIIRALKARDLYDKTEFLIVSSHGYKKRRRQITENAWAVSTQKIVRKGTLADIFPSLAHLTDIEERNLNFEGLGSSLFAY